MKRFLPLLLALMGMPPLAAHPDPSHTLEEIEEHLAKTPDKPALLRQKAELLLTTGHPGLARPVIQKLLSCPEPSVEDRLLEIRLLRAEKSPAALEKIITLTQSHPKQAAAWNLRAWIEEDHEKRQDAAASMRRSLELSPRPSPADALACASWFDETGRKDEALAVIDASLAKLGTLAGLQQKAIGLEMELGRPDAALRRIDALTRRFRPSVDLSLQRASILEKAGRHTEAAAACDTALALLEAMPASRQNTSIWRQQRDEISRKKQNLLSHQDRLKPSALPDG